MRNNALSVPRPPRLEEVQQQFESWRRGRQRQRPIPEPLWDAAVKLCEQHSISRVSTALGLNYSALKQRVENGSKEESLGPAGSPFVELKLSTGLWAEAPWVLELEDGRGRRLRLSGRPALHLDVPALTRAFWARAE